MTCLDFIYLSNGQEIAVFTDTPEEFDIIEKQHKSFLRLERYKTYSIYPKKIGSLKLRKLLKTLRRNYATRTK